MKSRFIFFFQVHLEVFEGEFLFHMLFCFCFQIHVIKPVLPKLNSLFEYAVSEENGNDYFYFDSCDLEFLFSSSFVHLPLTHYRELGKTFKSVRRMM